MPDTQPPWPLGVPEPPERWSWEHFGQALLNTLVQSTALTGFVSKLFEDVLPVVIGSQMALAIRLRANTALVFEDALNRVEAEATPLMLKLAAAGLSDYFGTTVSPGQLGRYSGSAERRATVNGLSQLVMDALYGAFEAGGQVSPDQGRRNAERAISYSLGQALAGWMESLLGPNFMGDLLPDFGGLDELVTSKLGFDRIAARAMRPLQDVLITEPFKRDLNIRFRPSIPTESELVRQLNRGVIGEGEFFDLMAQHGWTRERAGEQRMAHSVLPSKSELRGLLELGLLDAATVRAWLRAAGHSEQMAASLSTLLTEDRVRSYRARLATLAQDLLRDREVELTEFRSLCAEAGLSPLETDTLQAVALLERSRPKRLSNAQMEEAYRVGLVDGARLRAFYETSGYADGDAELLLGLAIRDKLAFEKREEQRAARPAPLPRGRVPRGAAEELYRRGLIQEPQLFTLLAENGITGQAAQLVVQLARARRDEYQRRLAERALPPPPRVAGRSAQEEGYSRGFVSREELSDYYAAQGFTDEARELLLELADAERAEWLAREAARLARAMGGATVERAS